MMLDFESAGGAITQPVPVFSARRFDLAIMRKGLHRLGKCFAKRVVSISLTWGPLKVAKCEKTG